MYSFSKYRDEYKANIKLAIPIIISQLGQIVVQLVDNMMVGQYGGNDPVPLAATAFGTNLFFLIYITVVAISFGITPLVGASFAQGDIRKCSSYLKNGFVLFPILGVVAMCAHHALIPFIPMMGQPVSVAEMAIPYYMYLVWSMIPVVIFFALKQFLEGIGNTKVAMMAVIIGNAVNILFNYLFIYGNWGFSEMGASGAGLATLIARIVTTLILVVYFFSAKQFSPYVKLLSEVKVGLAQIKELFFIGVPISCQVFFEASAFAITGFLVGSFGEVSISANQIAAIMSNTAFLIILSLSTATTIRVSHCYGHKDYKHIPIAANAAWHIGLAWNVVTATIFALFGTMIPNLFSTNTEVIDLASKLLLLVATYQILDGLQCIGVGVLRGMQHVKIVIPIAILSYWVLNIPVGYVCAHYLGMGVPGFFMGYIVGLSVAAILIYRSIRGKLKRLVR